jgi:hypothetical protein
VKKIIWIDVGTHFGQEYNSIFGTNFNFFKFICRRFFGGNILKRGKPVNINGLREIIYARTKIRKKSNEFYTVFIEANTKIVNKKNIYQNADIVFNFALIDHIQTSISITKLYLGDGNELSQGSSIFLEKDNVDRDSYITTLGVATNDFFSKLEMHFNKAFGEYDVLLRLNCEGIEDNVIYSAHKSFGSKLKLICGSLKDVEGVKGPGALRKLENFISNNKLLFIKFHSGIDTWPKAHNAVLNLLNEKDKG